MSRTAKAKAQPVSERLIAARSPRSPEPAASGRRVALRRNVPWTCRRYWMRCSACELEISPSACRMTKPVLPENSRMFLTRSSRRMSTWPGNSKRSAKWLAAMATPANALSFRYLLGAWGDMEASINALVDDLLWPTNTLTRAIAAVARGDLLHTVPLEVFGRPLKGEFLRSATLSTP